jgi:hypothetical protein
MEKHSAKPTVFPVSSQKPKHHRPRQLERGACFLHLAREHSLLSANVDKTRSPCFMYQRRAPQGVARALGRQVVVRQVVQFLLDEGNQGVKRLIAPTLHSASKTVTDSSDRGNAWPSLICWLIAT